EKVQILESNMQSKEAQVEEAEAKIKTGGDMLKSRLNAMYKSHNATTLGLVMGAESFSQFLSRAHVAAKIAEHDQKLIEELKVELSAINAAKEEIAENQAEVLEAKTEMSAKQNQLGSKLSQTEDMIQDIEALEKDYKANKAKIDKQMADVQAEVDAIYSQIKSVGKYEGGAMGWPVNGFYTITSPYGPRWGNFHTGIDIAQTNAAGQGIYGKPILAVADGTVAFVQSSFVAGRGYGIYAIIDHGGGISSLYGHQSGLNVKLGQNVHRGDVIGYVGSTGPHLHFEVRVNGKHVNPWTYLKK
ncbi:MAG: peptidoglycan DD-metalloendopeptidase family protein, partial [Oscillospiraceae bacterium]